MGKSNLWFWRSPDCRWKNKVLNHVKDVAPTDSEIIILNCCGIEETDNVIPLNNYLMSLCRRFNVFEQERVMFLNMKDLLLAIELCLARVKPQDAEDTVTDKDILKCYKAYTTLLENKGEFETETVLKTFIHDNNCIDECHLVSHLSAHLKKSPEIAATFSHTKFLILGTPQSDILCEIISILSANERAFDISVETPLNLSLGEDLSDNSPDEIKIISEPFYMSETLLNSDDSLINGSATEEYVEDTIVAFLSLLVNSRNELALSKVMISPVIEFSHEAFTALRHLAEEKKMPMCQTAISYVTRLRLGGKGYAPPADCPMKPHLKNLELFVDILNQMQTLIEEDLNSQSALKRLINILKKKLLKCSSEKLKPSAIETVCERLKNIVPVTMRLMKSEQYNSSAPQICQETLNVLHFYVNYINCCCWSHNPSSFLRKKQAKRTPINLPPLLGYFRSPDEESTCDSKMVSDDDSRNTTESSLFIPQPKISYFHHSESSSVSTCVDSTTPSKTTFKDCLKNKDLEESEFLCPPKKSKGCKRAILSEITNENKFDCKKVVQKKLKVQEKTQEKRDTKAKKVTSKLGQKVPKKLKLIEGQGRITSFFKLV